MKKMIVLAGMFLLGMASVNAEVIWSENFDGLAVGADGLVLDSGPVFGGSAPGVSVGDWAVTTASLSIADLGGGDHALRFDQTGGSRGAVIWLDVSDLGLVNNTTYTLQFAIDNWTLNGTSGTQADVFANVVRAIGINNDPESDATVTFDLARGSGFDNVTSAGGAEIKTTHNQWQTSFNPKTDGGIVIDQSSISAGSGVFSYDFLANNSEYIGIIIGKADQNGEQPSFDITNVSIIPEPATFGLVAAFGAAILFIRRRFMA